MDELVKEEKWTTTETKFCSVEVPLKKKGLSLFVDGNSKVTAENGTMEDPVPNAFSLPHIATCPKSTSVCRETCYVNGLMKYSPETYSKYLENFRVIQEVLMSKQAAAEAAGVLARHIMSTVTSFRWHVSGDVFSERYAQWIVRTCVLAPEVNFWIYTRSTHLLPTLMTAKNLVINVSADKENAKKAIQAARDYGLRVCYESTDGSFPELEQDDVVFPDYDFRGRKLDKPTDHPWFQSMNKDQRRLPCVADFWGQSEKTRCGPCNVCMRPKKENPKRVKEHLYVLH